MSSYIEAISQATTASAGASKSGATEETSMGKEDFLTLLVAQLQNQDPLNPDDATEFTAQLAQFSSLEQLFTLNESMNSLVSSNASADRLSILSTIGQEVVFHGDKINYSGSPLEIGYSIDGPAAEVTLALQQNGATVATLHGSKLNEGNHFITWDGLTSEGKEAPVGEYRVVVSAKAVQGESVAIAPLVKSEVTGVDLQGELGGTLVTQSGNVNFNEISGVYKPGSKIDDTKVEEDEKSIEETVETVAAITEDVKQIVE